MNSTGGVRGTELSVCVGAGCILLVLNHKFEEHRPGRELVRGCASSYSE